MNIPFHRVIKNSLYPVSIDNERFSVEASFSFQPKSQNMLLSHLHMVGTIRVDCNSCSDEVVLDIDEDVDFLVSNGIFRGSDKDFDVVEVLDNSINLQELLLGELELIASDYHHCEKCDGKIFEKEF